MGFYTVLLKQVTLCFSERQWTLSKKSSRMDFFGRLRQLSSTVERDVADIQRSFDLPQSERDSTDGAALLLLQEVKNDVKQVRVSCNNAR